MTPKPKLLPVDAGPSAESLAAVRRGSLTKRAAARFMSVSVSRVKELIRDGVFTTFLVGKLVMLSKTEVETYLAECRDRTLRQRGKQPQRG